MPGPERAVDPDWERALAPFGTEVFSILLHLNSVSSPRIHSKNNQLPNATSASLRENSKGKETSPSSARFDSCRAVAYLCAVLFWGGECDYLVVLFRAMRHHFAAIMLSVINLRPTTMVRLVLDGGPVCLSRHGRRNGPSEEGGRGKHYQAC